MRKIILAIAPVELKISESIEYHYDPIWIANDIIRCAQEGATMVHMHVRDANGDQTSNMETFSKTLALVREKSDIIIQGSTGGISNLSLEERCISVTNSLAEVASLNMGSTNFDESVYINTLSDIRYWATEIYKNQTHPELEVFDLSMVGTIRRLIDEGILTSKPVINICLGFRFFKGHSTFSMCES